jgi:hypothetical protein
MASAGEPPAPPALASRPVEYPVETFSAAERVRLEPHVTNLDRPVFALVNLPATVNGPAQPIGRQPPITRLTNLFGS